MCFRRQVAPIEDPVLGRFDHPMTRKKSSGSRAVWTARRRFLWSHKVFCLLVSGWVAAFATTLAAAEPAVSKGQTAVSTGDAPRFAVRAYVLKFNPTVFTNAPTPPLSDYAGTNISLQRIVQAASAALFEFQKRGYAKANISIAQEQISDGVVTMNVFQGAFPQVLISGRSFIPDVKGIAPAIAAAAPGATNATAALKTNAVPRFNVQAYEITGNTLLSARTLSSIFTKGIGTNMTLTNITQAASELQQEYRNRGYPTVSVTLPPQQITNAVVRIRVFEGLLSEILVTKNRYFSSNNVLRALPSLRTNTILNGTVFQAELDRANASQDRQIYPRIEPGGEPDTTLLRLDVKDRLPLHAKVELNNQNSPGTPELRVNGSAVYGNLWQLEHSLGLQYSFSPEQYKQGDQWGGQDRPLVANYSGFYRFPLGGPDSISEQVAAQPGSFGYSEATRKFQLPPPSGAPELNIYASRSTIDTGVQVLDTQDLYDVPNVRTVTRQDVQQDLTVNNTLGFRLSSQLPPMGDVVSTVSGGLDYKTYALSSFKTNNFNFVEVTLNAFGNPNPPVLSKVSSPVPPTQTDVHYAPLTVRWDGSRKDATGVWSGGFGYSVNFLGGLFAKPNQADDRVDFQNATGSTHADGYYHIFTASLVRDQAVYQDWRLTLRADGQWANQPLINNEKFGVGGVASVRGYHEGEEFGDTGWHVSFEQKTPGHRVGSIAGKYPVIFRGSIYLDYAESYLLDPQGRAGRIPLWGTGLGVVASVGSFWEARFLFSAPLLSTSTIEAYQPYFNFSLTAQF
jgi:hemolysin activation/secretion protein